MGTLLVVAGPPGAGKSTVARLLAERRAPGALVEGDAFFGFLAAGAIEPWLPAAREQNTVVVRAAAAATGQLARGFHTVYDGVIGPWFLAEFLPATGLDRLDYVVLLPSVECCVDRVATRVGHSFTDAEATRKMHREFAEAEVDPRHVLVDPPGTPADAAAAIATAAAAGTLSYPR